MESYNKSELKEIIHTYPFFSAALIELAAKTVKDNDEDAGGILKISALHVSDQLWLNYLLQEKSEKVEDAVKEEIISADEQRAADRIAEMLSAHAEGYKRPVLEAELLVEKPEPLFKTDYFKHQGVDSDAAETQLDQRVRKFSDWIRQMKKLNPTTPNLNTSEAEEKAAAEKALHSLQNQEVLTESMAEVLLLQGKSQQAIYIYEKLSLYNPEKSVYFASKIASLKEK